MLPSILNADVSAKSSSCQISTDESPPAMASETPAAAHLPVELWRHIFAYLELSPLALEQKAPTEDYYVRCRALQNLCLTSHWLLAIARPYLYETIVLCANRRAVARWAPGALPARANAAGIGSVFLLVRTLNENHALRHLIKNLALLSTNSESIYPDIQESTMAAMDRDKLIYLEWRRSMQKAPCDLKDMAIFEVLGLTYLFAEDIPSDVDIELGSNDPKRARLHGLGLKLVAVLLNMTVKVDKLLVCGLLITKTFVGLALDDPFAKVRALSSEQGAGFLPELKTLQSQGSEDGTLSGGTFASHRKSVSSSLLRSPKLKSLHIVCAWRGRISIDEDAAAGLAAVEELHLTVFSGFFRAKNLLDAAKQVKTLSIRLGTPNDELTHQREGIPPCDLNDILLTRADTLESFSLDTRGANDTDVAEGLGPLEKIVCLHKMHKLTHLTIEPHLIIDWFEVNTWPHFLSYMPPSLVSLTFRFMPEHGHDQLRIWARSGLGAVLRASREKWQSKMPKLRKIHLLPLPFPHRAVDAIKEDLEACGIALTWVTYDDMDSLDKHFGQLSLAIH